MLHAGMECPGIWSTAELEPCPVQAAVKALLADYIKAPSLHDLHLAAVQVLSKAAW